MFPSKLKTAAITGLLALPASPLPVAADTVADWHTWGAVVASGRLGSPQSKARFWLEGQGRFNDDSSRFNQGIVRGALGHAVAERAALWAGYAYIPTDPRGVADTIDEHRIWQQLTWRTAGPVAGFSWSTRTRLEQRAIEGADDIGWRFRQLVKLTRPLGTGGRLYLSLWDELFVNLNDTDGGPEDGIDQNRIFGGLGVRLGEHARTEIGYMNQHVRRPGQPNPSNHILSLTLLLSY